LSFANASSDVSRAGLRPFQNIVVVVFCLCGVAICAVRDPVVFNFHGHDFVIEFSGGNCGERLLVARE